MNFDSPRLAADRLQQYIQAELPGIDFRVEQSDSTLSVTLEWQRRVEGYRAAISDLEMMGSPEALPAVTLAAIDAYREKAMEDYGLRAILEREKTQAHRDGFRAMVQNLTTYVNEHMIQWDEVLNDDGEPTGEVVNAGPNWEGRRLLRWAGSLTEPTRGSDGPES